jgi:hypothetical protein
MTKQSYRIKIRRYRMKREAVKLLGGKCVGCGWSGNIAGFLFHHRDPSMKEFSISECPKVSWEKYWKEIEKCNLMCATCHEILHANNTDEQFLKDVENYSGRDLVLTDIPWKNQTHVPRVYPHTCQHCDNPFTSPRRIQKYCCPNCQRKHRRKCNRPSKVKLEILIRSMPMTRIGKKYGVTDNAVRKWCKAYQILI